MTTWAALSASDGIMLATVAPLPITTSRVNCSMPGNSGACGSSWL
ncbi:hypothetical protein [Mycobacterium sp. URHB0021]